MFAYIIPATPLVDTSIAAHKEIVTNLGQLAGVHVGGLYEHGKVRAHKLSERIDIGFFFYFIIPRLILTHRRATLLASGVCYNNTINGQSKRI